MEQELMRLRQLMTHVQVDGVLLRKRRSFSWLTGGKDNHILLASELGVADLLVFPERVFCVTTRMEAQRILEEELAEFPEIELVTTEWYEGCDPAIRKLCAGKKIGTDSLEAVMTFGFVDLRKALAELTYVLTPAQQEQYRTLCREAALAVEHTCKEIHPGMTEHEIAGRMAENLIAKGIDAQLLLVATDERIHHYRHPIPTEKRLERTAILVTCAQKYGLVANLTRFVHFGKADAELLRAHRDLADIHLDMILATRPGVPVNEVLRTGIAAYRRHGYGEEWKGLHLGGATGFASREYIATFDTPDRVLCHQAFAWNPSLPGAKMEDTFLVGETENEILTHTGEWDYITVTRDGKLYQRPNVLIRDVG
jgi:Xaa-Pro dipeptidase